MFKNAIIERLSRYYQKHGAIAIVRRIIEKSKQVLFQDYTIVLYTDLNQDFIGIPNTTRVCGLRKGWLLCL